MDFYFNTHRHGTFGGSADASDLVHGYGVERISKLTDEQYQSLIEVNAKTLYLVQMDTGIKIYLGSIALYTDGVPEDLLEEIQRIASVADFIDSTINNTIIPEITQLQEIVQEHTDAILDLKSQILPHVVLTQEEYEALDPPDPDTLYVINES